MAEKKIRRAPIVSNNRASGIVTYDDLISMLAKELNTLAQIPREQSSWEKVSPVSEALLKEAQIKGF